ncbi:hypothetical protein GOBAR_AA24262 [Gossypium barbadense]|uniref:Uncharacterized protein n=1 Tax=Gossypium barbadense TaxID=3634 RepID=A0A2P5WZB1_GOSBA|nr:hypothetical protein GOBAR_AA24262 [Gossypium barbadense]
MVATTWDKLLRAAKNCHKRAMLYMFVNQISMLGSVLDDDWLVEAEKQAMQEDEEITYNDVQQFYGDDMDELNSVTIDDDSLDFLDDGSGREGSYSATYSRVVRTGVPKAHGGRRNRGLIQIPFLLIVLGTVGLGGLNATRGLNSEFINLVRAYRKQKEACPSHNPFLP